MKQSLLDKLNIFMLKKGYVVKNLTRSCFDILARKGQHILLIKVLEDANAVNHEYTQEMTSIASYIHASPLIISEKAGGKLDDNVVYSRFNIYTLNFNTFISCIQNKFPFVKSSHVGLTASVLGKKLKEKREELGYSLNSLSKKIGVTSRMVMKYEDGNSEVTINRAMKLYDLFGEHIFNEVDVFVQQTHADNKNETDFSKKYLDLGFEATETRKSPFDIIARKDNEIILTEISDKANPHMQSLSKLLDADNLVIFNKKKPKQVPSMTKKEFMDFEEANELVRFLKEY